MVAVADREQHRRGAGRHGQARGEGLRLDQREQGALHGARLRLADREAAQVTTAGHQLGVVQRTHRVAPGGCGLDHGAQRVVDQHQDVRQLELGAAAHLDARRQPLDDGALGGADQALGRGAEVVVLEVQLEHQPAARVRAAAPFDQHRAVMLDQHAVGQIALHRRLNARDALGRIVGAQVSLGEDQVQRRCGIADLAPQLLPVLRLRGVLVARHHRPLAQVDARPRQEQVRQPEGGAGVVSAGGAGAGVGRVHRLACQRAAMPASRWWMIASASAMIRSISALQLGTSRIRPATMPHDHTPASIAPCSMIFG